MASDSKELTTRMAQAGARAGAPVLQSAKKDAVAELFSGKRNSFAQLLGKSMDPERFMRILVTKVRGNEALMTIAINNPASVIAACMEIAQVGLDPSIANEAWLIPYGNEAKAQYGFKGLAKLAREAAIEAGSPLILLRQEMICENDTYTRELGSEMRIKHTLPDFPQHRGAVLGYYAIAKDCHYMTFFDEMSIEAVEEHQRKFCKGLSSSKSPFYGGRKSPNFDAYGLKTVLRRMINRYMPMSPKLSRAVTNDADSEIPAEEVEALDISPTGPIPAPENREGGDDQNGKEKDQEGQQRKL